jgi:menaquinone-dependent protoporphyrinogen oxidase
MSTPQLRVLIAYATRYGSTREVADHVGTVGFDNGATIEVVPAHSVAGR